MSLYLFICSTTGHLCFSFNFIIGMSVSGVCLLILLVIWSFLLLYSIIITFIYLSMIPHYHTPFILDEFQLIEIPYVKSNVIIQRSSQLEEEEN